MAPRILSFHVGTFIWYKCQYKRLFWYLYWHQEFKLSYCKLYGINASTKDYSGIYTSFENFKILYWYLYNIKASIKYYAGIYTGNDNIKIFCWYLRGIK